MAGTKESNPSEKRRSPLTKDRVLRTAIRLVDEGGVESLSMRRLGRALGVEAMALYNHVANKDEILDGIIDLVLDEVDLTPEAAGWDDAMRASAISVHEALLRHPWASGLILSPATIRVIPARIRYMESILGRLTEAGFSAALTYHGYHALDSHILGFTLWEIGHTIDSDKHPDLVTTFLRDFGGEQPYLAEHVRQHLDPASRDGLSEFEFGLDLILDGLRRMGPQSSLAEGGALEIGETGRYHLGGPSR